MSIIIAPAATVLLPLGLLIFFFRPRYLVPILIITLPLFHLYVASVAGTPIRAFHYFGGLLICRDIARRASSRQFNTSLPKTSALLLLFLTTVLLSLPMPVLLSGQVNVVSLDTRYRVYDVVPLSFGPQNLTQFVYLAFGALLFFALVPGLHRRNFNSSIRFLNTSAVIVMLSGVAFQIASLVDRSLIDSAFWFFTGSRDTTTLFGRAAYGSIGLVPRMFSLAGEPGFTGLFLLLPWSFALAAPRRRKLWLFMLTFSILLTGATTAYFGAAFILATGLLVSLTRRSLLRNILPSAGLLACMFMLFGLGCWMLLHVNPIQYVVEAHLWKLTGDVGSGVTRSETIEYTLRNVFAKSPIFGVGYGSHRAPSFGTFLLANIGVLGTIAFLIFNASLARRAYRVLAIPEVRKVALAAVAALCGILLAILAAKGAVTVMFGWYWFLLAFIESIGRLKRFERGSAPAISTGSDVDEAGVPSDLSGYT